MHPDLLHRRPIYVERENPIKAANQLRKAKVLADLLKSISATAEDVNNVTVRILAERAAGDPKFVNSSATTWAMVKVLLEG